MSALITKAFRIGAMVLSTLFVVSIILVFFQTFQEMTSVSKARKVATETTPQILQR